MNKSIILVEHAMDVNALKNLSVSVDKVVTLDFVAHKKLQNARISHDFIEDYFETDDENYIDNLIRHKSTNWYKNNEISSWLEFEDINLGWLLEIEIFSYLTQIIKQFVGIIRLMEKESFTHAYCSDSVSKIIKNISDKIITQDLPVKSENNFLFENVEIPLRIGGRLIPIRLSRNTTLQIKKIMEFSTNLVYSKKPDIKKTKNRLLLLDVNVINYSHMLDMLSKNFELILLNERKPVIWNLKSLNIVKKLKCKIINLQDFKNSHTELKIDLAVQQLEYNMKKLFEHDKYFNDFFSALNMSFWHMFKENFTDTCNSRFKDAVRRFILAKELFDNLSVDKMLVLYNTGFEEKVILSAAKTNHISGIVLEHGYMDNPAYLKKYFPVSIGKMNSGFKWGVWGERSRSVFSKSGIPDEDLLVIGSPRHDRLFKTLKQSARKIIFFDTTISGISFQEISTHYMIRKEETVIKICKKLNGLQSYDFLVKLHPHQYALPYSLKPVIEKIDKKIPIYQTENAADFLSDCALAIAPKPTTVLLEAMIMGIPTIVYTPEDFWDADDIFASKSSMLVHSYDDFEKALSKILDDRKFREALISRGHKYIKHYFLFPSEISKNIENLA